MARSRRALTVGALVVTVVAVGALAGWWVVRDDGASNRTSARRNASAGTSPGTSQPATTQPCNAESVIASWPLEQRLAQLVMVGVDPRSGNEAKDVVARYGVGGVFIGGQATGIFADGSLAGLVSPAGIPVLVAVDEEGGRVQRIDQLAGSIPSARAMAQTMTPAQVHDVGLARGQELRRLGVTMDLAPVVDVSNQGSGQVIGDRSFGNDPGVVADYAGAFASGLRDAGVVPVIKHFPGHGHAAGDSHRESAVTPPVGELEASDLIPFRRLVTEPQLGVMIGHLDVPGLTAPNEPATVSPGVVNDLLRTQLGYGGFVITDDLSQMAAIRRSYGVPEAALRALAAGSDMALFVTSAELPDVLVHLADAVRSQRLDEAQVNRSVLRVLAVKAVDPCRQAAP
jgi:beta-N-acetylhexosaminidase